jgi:hypothetical protein
MLSRFDLGINIIFSFALLSSLLLTQVRQSLNDTCQVRRNEKLLGTRSQRALSLLCLFRIAEQIGALIVGMKFDGLIDSLSVPNAASFDGSKENLYVSFFSSST